MTREQLIERIKKQGTPKGKEYELGGIAFEISADDKGIEKVRAKVDGVEFMLWGHYEDIEQFYMPNALKLKDIPKMAKAHYKLARVLGVPIEDGIEIEKGNEPTISDEVLEKLQSMTDEIKEATKEAHLNEGKVQAYEHVLAGVQITIQK